MKKIALLASVAVLSTSLYAGKCSDGFKLDFTFYGAADKSYVVTKNTFKKMTTTFTDEKLLNATVEIDALSIDTSADLSKGKQPGKWPAAMANMRNNNTINNFFKNFEKDVGKLSAKVVKVEDKTLTVAVTMNGVTKELPFAYKAEGDVLKASGKLDVLAFNTSAAWKKFETVCKGFHQGKSWSELDVYFEVPASCK